MQEEKIFNNMMGGGDRYPFFSIIIPVYNTEKYIARCLESCIHQTFKDIEIIVVDDCGEDNAIQIAQEYAKKDSRIKIIHNPQNLGLFHTRIVGETKALGEYIIHLDSDDCFEHTLCLDILPYCKQEYDIVAFGFMEVGFNQKNTKIDPIIGKIDGNKLLHTIKTGTMYGKAFKTHLIKEVDLHIFNHFKNKIPNINMLEDGLKYFFIIPYTKNYIGLDIYPYLHYYNPTSMTAHLNNSKSNQKKIYDLKLVYCNIKIIIQKYNFLLKEKTTPRELKNILKDFYQHIRNYTYIYYHSKAYENKPFAYPINFLKSLWYVRSPKVFGKTIVRIFIYCITLGRKKI